MVRHSERQGFHQEDMEIRPEDLSPQEKPERVPRLKFLVKSRISVGRLEQPAAQKAANC